MSGLAAHITGLGAVGAVARDVAGLVAVVAGLRARVTASLGAGPGDVTSLVAVVARRLVRALRALTRYVPRAVTPAINHYVNTIQCWTSVAEIGDGFNLF